MEKKNRIFKKVVDDSNRVVFVFALDKYDLYDRTPQEIHAARLVAIGYRIKVATETEYTFYAPPRKGYSSVSKQRPLFAVGGE